MLKSSLLALFLKRKFICQVWRVACYWDKELLASFNFIITQDKMPNTFQSNISIYYFLTKKYCKMLSCIHVGLLASLCTIKVYTKNHHDV